jgi:hypothetical protein
MLAASRYMVACYQIYQKKGSHQNEAPAAMKYGIVIVLIQALTAGNDR